MSGRPLVVIPGGTGYAGGRIVEHLARRGWRVRVTSRSRTTWPGSSSDHIEVIRLDENAPQARTECLRTAKAVVMLAGADESRSQANPAGAVRATCEQCMAWLQASHDAEVERFVYFSTVQVYGAPGEAVLSEDTEPRPIRPYATTHLAAELFTQAAHRAGGRSAVIFRLSNSFGAPVWPGIDQWPLLLNDLARQAVLDRRLVLKSDGLQARDFIPLSDVGRAVAWALERDARGAEAEVYNLGSGRSTTILEMTLRLAQRCETVLGFLPPISRAPDRSHVTDGTFSLATDRLARAGFAPQGDWDAELDGLLRFCRDHAPALAGH
jgi:UDP-glucose 4-epimerase